MKSNYGGTRDYIDVASFAEAWIEIGYGGAGDGGRKASPPSRRRGLKSESVTLGQAIYGRLLRGGVD